MPSESITGYSPAIVARFMAKVEVQPDGCWTWKGGMHFRMGAAGSPSPAPVRASWLLFRGEAVSELSVVPTCQTEGCVRPEHLAAMTRDEFDAHRRVSLEDRLWKMVSKEPGQGPEGACWEWQGGTSSNGYGKIKVYRQGRKTSAGTHVAAYELTYGPVLKGLCVCHRCDNKRCCRPDHLFLGSVAQNNADSAAKGRQAKGEKNGAVRHFERRPRGEENANSRLTEDKVREIRRCHDLGTTQGDLAVRMGVARTTISAVVRRKTWRQVK